MRYNVVKNANKIIDSSSYLIKNPESYKGKWKDVFSNNNPICLELGMGRGSFIIEMAKKHPNINYIGLELDSSQTATAINNIKNQKLQVFNEIKRSISTLFCDCIEVNTS